MASSSDSTAHIAMFPSPGMGHLIPFVELAKLLLHRGHISSATLILPTTTTSTTASALLQSLPDNLRLHHLPPITADNLTTDSNQTPESEIFRSIALSLDSACVALADLAGSPLAALVVDPFGLDLLDGAKELDVSVFMYFGTAAMNLLFTFHLPEFEKMLAKENDDKEFEDSPDPFILPGCPPLHGRDFGDPFKNRKSGVYKRFLHQIEKSKTVHGILVNTFINLESGAISGLKQAEQPPVYPIGPVVGSGQDVLSRPVVDWLDGQPVGSVLYVSFGSGGTLSNEQTSELALGLEESGQRFFWVVRCPNDANSCPTYVGIGDLGSDPLGFLPEGFVERTRGRALVVPNWAPQVGVLAHRSTGGFLTHCGWNSALESIMHGVPMIAWPLYAEQRTNAVALTEGLGVAVRTAGEGGGVVMKEEVVRVVRRVMEEGGGLRERAEELKEEAHRALGEGGSSSLSLCEFGARLNS